MIFKNPYWSTKTRIELLQKWILVHSFIYYEMDKNVVPDHMYDANGVQLRQLMQSDLAQARASKWHYVFKDFTGATGFHLYGRLKGEHKIEISHIAEQVALKLGGGKIGKALH